jgi:hypothetical protein
MSKLTAKDMRALTGIKRKVWHYSGDVDIAYGGMFYSMDDIAQGYANAVRVTPCADAGGPDNMWWVERITINVHNGTWPYEGVGETAAERAAHRVLHDMIDSTAEAALNSYGFDSNLAAWDDLTPRQHRDDPDRQARPVLETEGRDIHPRQDPARQHEPASLCKESMQLTVT